MGEKLFIEAEVNSKTDVRVLGKGVGAMVDEAGVCYLEAVQKFVDGAREGREDLVAQAKLEIAEASTCLDALAKVVVAQKAFPKEFA